MDDDWAWNEDPDAETMAAYKAWCETRPPVVQVIAKRLPPWRLYRLKPTGQIVTLAAIAEDGTVRVDVTGEFNAVLFDRSVFGINPDDLEPCGLPGPEVVTGTMLTSEQVDASKDFLRAAVRPDLWVLGSDGVARRKDN